MGLSAPWAFQFQNQLARLDFIDEVPQPSVTAATPKLHLRREHHRCLLPKAKDVEVLKLPDGRIKLRSRSLPVNRDSLNRLGGKS